MMRLYRGCGTRRMTSTTIVLAILEDMTEPTFSFLLLGVVSAIGCFSPFLPFFADLGAAFETAFLGAALAAAALAAVLPVFLTTGTGAAAAAEGAVPFSFSTVRMRARSLRRVRTFFTPSICPMDI